MDIPHAACIAIHFQIDNILNSGINRSYKKDSRSI